MHADQGEIFFGHAVWYMGSEFLDQGSNPCRLHWECREVTNGPPGKSLGEILENPSIP